MPNNKMAPGMQLVCHQKLPKAELKCFEDFFVLPLYISVMTQAGIKTALPGMDLISVCGSRGRTDTDAELIYAA